MDDVKKIETAKDERDAISIAELAKKCGISRRSVERGIKQGHIKAFRIGGRHLIPRAELARIFSPMTAA
ncbi:MAG: hypothetical protein C0467_25510 [Planctomycetaceae bacterium]|nr:hypothetical protein [Planctomycetaceae bacterium]